jgi:hypothetical protein
MFRRRCRLPQLRLTRRVRFVVASAGLLLVHDRVSPLAVAAGSISLTALGTPYTQDFNTLASSGTSSTVPNGWAFFESGTSARVNGLYTANTGSDNAGDTYSYGTTPDRALGMLLSGTFVSTLGRRSRTTRGRPSKRSGFPTRVSNGAWAQIERHRIGIASTSNTALMPPASR